MIVSLGFSILNTRRERLEYHSATVALAGSVEFASDTANDGDELGTPPVYRRDDENWTLEVVVNYSNYLVARGLVGVVDEWYYGLKRLDVKYPKSITTKAVAALSANEELYDWPWKITVPILLVSATAFLADSLDRLDDFLPGSDLAKIAIFVSLFAIFSYVNAYIFHERRLLYHRDRITLSCITEQDRSSQDSCLRNIQGWRATRRFWERTFIVQVISLIIAVVIALIVG